MNKIVKSILTLTLGSTFAFAACMGGCSGDPDSGNTTQKYDPETRTLKMSIGALDGNFNPFFYTTGNDGTVVNMTQVGMLSSDASGNVACGKDYPSVVQDFEITYKDANGNATTTGTKEGSSTYRFVIKNGMKFSDGQPLTIKDVLFSLYVYLDPAYTGSATLYSVDIQGMNAYRNQDKNAADGEGGASLDFTAQAYTRIQYMIDYVNDEGSLTPQIEEDIAMVKKLFKEELASDWTNVSSSFGSREIDEYEYRFTEVWEAYYLNEGIVSIQTYKKDNGATAEAKDENGRYYTTLDPKLNADGTFDANNAVDNDYAQEMEDAINDPDRLAQYSNVADEALRKEYVMRDFAIETVYKSKFGANDNSYTSLPEILTYWATASTALEAIISDIRADYYDSISDSDKVKSISGVKTSKTTSFKGVNLGAEHDVLEITINGIDPKAIWNFGFNVCPLHYYSGTFEGVNYVTAFNGVDNFGVKIGDPDFINDVLKASEKNRYPVGAGVYKAAGKNGAEFYANKYVNYERNTYFDTMDGDGVSGAGSTICNAKIKKMTYQEIADNQILTMLERGDIDYGMPNATIANYNKANESTTLKGEAYFNNGYGYVGINPKYVPDINVRKVLMKAIEASYAVAYYNENATQIYRPMSKMSWAYPYNDTDEHYYVDRNGFSYAPATTPSELTALLSDYRAGTDTNEKGKAILVHSESGEKLEYTFTIAGESKEHPAYTMFTIAKDTLENIGFKITVKNDATALSKLATGGLEVWAAAWTSSIDPDMYQVYHKDSKATSVNNWNYKEILSDSTGKWDTEYELIMELSEKIDEGRETMSQSSRTQIYAEALDIIMELAVELPTYQRKDLEVYNKTVIDAKTLNATPNHLEGLLNKLWLVNYL